MLRSTHAAKRILYPSRADHLACRNRTSQSLPFSRNALRLRELKATAESVEAQVPLQRIGEAEEVARQAVPGGPRQLLLMGTELVVDGGCRRFRLLREALVGQRPGMAVPEGLSDSPPSRSPQQPGRSFLAVPCLPSPGSIGIGERCHSTFSIRERNHEKRRSNDRHETRGGRHSRLGCRPLEGVLREPGLEARRRLRCRRLARDPVHAAGVRVLGHLRQERDCGGSRLRPGTLPHRLRHR